VTYYVACANAEKRRRMGLPDMNRVHVLFREPPLVKVSAIIFDTVETAYLIVV
jgi:hypothetical protein